MTGTVVAAAIMRDGLVLAARRTWPVEAAGRWELPGGKVETGETPADALVREIDEELGCAVVVERWLDGAAPIQRPGRGDLELRAAVCRLVSGEPTPVDHDRLRWLAPEQLDEVDWLEPDRPFLVELREVLLDGVRLPGGNVGGAVRIGDTVRRPVGPWTPAVHAILAHLAHAGLPAVPRVHGRDACGREVLDFLPGEVVDVDHDELADVRLAALGAWTARLHDALAGWSHPGPWRFFGVDDTETVAHNDLAPYNVCWVGDEIAGVFDWDLAGPSTRLLELAQVAWTSVPLLREASGDPDHAARRLHLLTAAYGRFSAADVLDAVPARVRIAIDGIRASAARGDSAMAEGQAAVGEPARTEVALARLEARLPALREAVASFA